MEEARIEMETAAQQLELLIHPQPASLQDAPVVVAGITEGY
jgi:hypothetical protein